MNNRYGRHGPRAWLRLRERRYARRSLLPVVSPSTVIVYVPAWMERIIFIVIRPNDYDDNEDNNQPIPLPDVTMKFIGTSQELLSEFHSKLKRLAEFEATAKFNNDKQRVLDRNGEWPLDQSIEREASVKSDVFLRSYIDSDIDIEAERQLYVRYYMEKYRACYGGTLPNEDLKKIRDEALRDASVDRQDNIAPSEQELNFHAIIRVQEIFGYETRLASGYLTHIMQHSSQYKQAYKEERDRLARSAPFLDR